MIRQGASPNADRFDAGSMTVHCSVGQMIQTAMTIGAAFGHELHLAGPASWDGRNPPESSAYPRMRTFSSPFTSGVLAAVDAANLRAPSRFVWTQHNYGDLDEERDTTAKNNVVHQTRLQLENAWTGYSEGNGPIVFVTEGGAHLSTIQDKMAATDLSPRTRKSLRSRRR